MESSLHQSFLNPANEFTPIPFWFWNDQLTNEEIIRQIHEFAAKGVNGFVLHPRIGIPKEIGYLSDEFMEFVRVAVAEANKLDMSVILYDEAMYPSGSAKGKVVERNPAFASRGLMVVEQTCKDDQEEYDITLKKEETLIAVFAAKRIDQSTLEPDSLQELSFSKGYVQFQPPDDAQWVIVAFIETNTDGTIRGIHFGEDDGEEHAPPSADLLNPEAVKAYIEITHDRYYDVLQDYFGNTVMAMFTDEPDMLGRNAKAGLKPWTGGSFTWYEQQGGKKSDLPALWFDIGRETEAIRKRYEQAVYRRLSTVYYRQLSQWCEQHGIALTGHPAESDDIGLLEHFQIPGQDVVWRWVAPEEEKGLTGRHSTAGKCSADAARHRGRRRNADEVLGVCGKNGSWDLPPGDMKWYFDWLFVRGVNLIIPHAFYYSIDGKRRSHERPPDVGLHSSWWPYYQLFSQYIKRLSWLLTDSVNTTKVAVLCQENHLPWELVKPLFEQQIEFNYFEEALLHSSAKIKNGLIHIEKQSYSTVVIEAGLLLSNETITRLNELITQGGSVFIVGKSTNVLEAAITIQQTEDLIEHLIERGHKTAQLTPQSANIRISHMKKEGTSFYLIVNEGEEVYDGHITLSERGAVERWDAWTGGIKELGNVAEFPLTLQRRESLVVMVDPSKEQPVKVNGQKETRLNEIMILEQEWSITGERIQKRTSNLQSWTEWPELAFYSGSVIYTATFELNNKIQKAVIDFGEVHEIVELSVNGQKVGVKLWAPYTFEVDSMLQQGINKIELKVTNSKANEMDQIALHSGLIGPVKVLGDCE